MRQGILFTAMFSALFGMAGALSAQTATGQITGTVRDSSGAVLPQVKVTIRSQDTGLTHETATSGSGDYSFTLLPVGSYAVSAEEKGFSTAKRNDIRLNVDQVQRVDLSLSVGSTSETITVEAPSVAVETETAGVGQVVNERQVTQLPLNGRNFLQLLFLSAGALSPPNGEQGSMRQGEGGAISINGARPTSNNYLLDGMVNTDTALNTPAVVLSVDAIQEFKEQTATYAYVFGNLVTMGIDVAGESQLVGYPTQFPSVSMVDWNTGAPNARYRVLELLKNNIGPGDKIVDTSGGSPYVYALGFIASDGKHKLLLVNKRERDIELTLPQSAKVFKLSISPLPTTRLQLRN